MAIKRTTGTMRWMFPLRQVVRDDTDPHVMWGLVGRPILFKPSIKEAGAFEVVLNPS